jgi:hypothetical protein
MSLKKRLILYCVSLVALGLLALPAVVIGAFGWVHNWGNNTSAYLLLVAIYVVWAPAVTFSMVAILDRLGIHYAVYDRPARPTRKERRRARAGLRYIAGQEEARRAAAQSRQRAPRTATKASTGARPRTATKASTGARPRAASAPPPHDKRSPRDPGAGEE